MKVNIYDLISPIFFVLLFINDYSLNSVSILLTVSLVSAVLTGFLYRRKLDEIAPEIISSILVFILLFPMLLMEVGNGRYYAQAIIAVPLCIICMPLIFKFASRARLSSLVLFSFFVLTVILKRLSMGDLNPFGYNVTYKILIFFAFCSFLSIFLKKILFSAVLWGSIILNLSRGGFLTALIAQLALKKINKLFLIMLLSAVIIVNIQDYVFVRSTYLSFDNASEMARIGFIKNTIELMSDSSFFAFMFGLGSENDLGTYPHNIFLELFLYGGSFSFCGFCPCLFFLFLYLLSYGCAGKG